MLFYSNFGNAHSGYDRKSVKKIFYTGENTRPNFEECDFAFSFDQPDGLRNYRLPLWIFYINWFGRPLNEARDMSYLLDPKRLLERKGLKKKDKFCNFIYYHDTPQRRSFFQKLSLYKRIDSGGALLNNIGHEVMGRQDQQYKVDFISEYKFTITFENSSYPGYATEKILHPLYAGSIPIYWGSPLIGRDFNEKAFLNLHNFSSEENLIEEIIKIDKDDSLYEKMLREPVFNNNQFPDFCLPENVLGFIERKIL